MPALGVAAIGWRVGEQCVLHLEVCLKRFQSLLIQIPLQLSHTAIPVCTCSRMAALAGLRPFLRHWPGTANKPHEFYLFFSSTVIISRQNHIWLKKKRSELSGSHVTHSVISPSSLPLERLLCLSVLPAWIICNICMPGILDTRTPGTLTPGTGVTDDCEPLGGRVLGIKP